MFSFELLLIAGVILFQIQQNIPVKKTQDSHILIAIKVMRVKVNREKPPPVHVFQKHLLNPQTVPLQPVLPPNAQMDSSMKTPTHITILACHVQLSLKKLGSHAKKVTGKEMDTASSKMLTLNAQLIRFQVSMQLNISVNTLQGSNQVCANLVIQEKPLPVHVQLVKYQHPQLVPPQPRLR